MSLQPNFEVLWIEQVLKNQVKPMLPSTLSTSLPSKGTKKASETAYSQIRCQRCFIFSLLNSPKPLISRGFPSFPTSSRMVSRQNVLFVRYSVKLQLVYITREQHLSVISDATLQISKECFVAKKYIDANYAKNITLDLLAEITHINKFYLSHSFTEYVGTSPINYLMETRLAASKELLLSSSRSIAEVASSTGFSSQSYFSQI